MTLLDKSFVACINRGYFNLDSFDMGAFHLYSIEFSYRNLVGEKLINAPPVPYNIQVIMPPSFRESLMKETGLIEYHVQHPLQLPTELRTERWGILCEYLMSYQELSTLTKLMVVKLLKSLCFHQTVLEYVPELSADEISRDGILATMALCRAFSSLVSQLNSDTFHYLDELEKVAHHAPTASQTKLSAALQLNVQYAKTFRNLEASEFWRTVATQELENLKSSLDEFTYNLLVSIYYRAVVFVPLLQKDKQKVVEEMDLAEFYGESLPRNNEVQQIIADENRNIVLESRTKEALWLRDVDLAEKRARQLTQYDPLDPRYRLELGEILIKQNKIEEAAKMYRSAARLGPPGTAIAWFMAGQCHERLGELDIACDCYLASVQMDELAISAVEKLNKLAPRLGNSALKNWSNIRLLQLQEQQNSIANQPRTSYIPEASSELKLAGEKALAQV